MKRILSLLVAMVMTLGCVGITAMAEEEAVTKIVAADYESFAKAMTAANNASGAVEVEISGTVEFVDGMELNGSYTSIAFVGKTDDATMTINQSAGGDYLEAHGKTVAFADLTLAKANPAWSGNSGHMGNYFSVQGGTVTYTNCTFPNGACTSTGTATYNNCTFENASEYGLWVYDDALVTVNGGTIDSKKGIKVYSEGEDSVTSTLTVENATFTENVTAKPAVAIGYAESITLIGNTYNNTTGVLELDSGSDADCEGVTFVAQDANGNDIASTLTAVDRNNSNAACGVLVDGKIYTTVATAAEEATTGSTVTLLHDSTEIVELPEGVTLDTNSYTAENVTVKVSAPVEVATYAELVAALAQGGNIILTADITTAAALTTSGITATIDLNGKTLNVRAGDNKFNDASNITIKNGTINIDGVVVAGNAIFCLDEYEETLVTTLTLENVDLEGKDYSSAYGVFYIGDSSVLNVNGGTWTLSNDKFSAGGVFKADSATATLNISDATMDLHNVRRVVTYADTTIENSTLTIYGDADGVDTEMEHGFNRSPLAVVNSTITMTDMVGRGITAECGAVSISEGSTVTIENVQEATIDVRAGQTVTVSADSTVSVDEEPTITSGTISGNVTKVEKVAEVNGVSYLTLAEALEAAKDSKEIVVELLADATLDITAWQTLAIGDEATEKITINGNGKTLTFNKKNSDWNNIATNNNATLILNDMTLTDSGYNDGPWNRYDLNFACDVELNGVTSTKALAFKAGATLNTVTINESGDNYAIWIQPNGQTVDIDGLTVTSAGRGIKIDDQYVDSAKKVNLNVSDATFTTVKKAAILVKSPAGADITATNVDITNVAADSTNLVWVDEEGASAFGTVTVTGANVAVEGGEESFSVAILSGDTVKGYYKDLQEAFDAAAAGTGNVTVEILTDIDLTNVDWNPVTVSAPGYPVVTVNGNNKTITGLNDMLFAGTWAGNSGLIINDLTIADSNIVNDKDDTKSTVGVGAFIGYPQASETITLNNCHLVNSTVEGGHWTGGLIGMAGGYNGNDGPVFMNLTITDCSVTGSTITGKGSVGGVIGHGSCAAWTNVVIENTTVSGNTITSTGSSTNKAGAVMGTIGAAGQSTTAAGETKTGGASVSATVSDNTVTSNGTTITTIYGRQGTATGMLYVAGGTYDNNPIEENVTYAQPAEGYEIVQNTDGTYGVQKAAEENLATKIAILYNYDIMASEDSGQDSYLVRAYCATEALEGYNAFGFEFKVGDRETVYSKAVETLFESISCNMVGQTEPYKLLPTVLLENGMYLYGMKAYVRTHDNDGNEINTKDTVLHIRPYAVKENGTTIYGAWRTTSAIGVAPENN